VINGYVVPNMLSVIALAKKHKIDNIAPEYIRFFMGLLKRDCPAK